jgi:hypothetical protein
MASIIKFARPRPVIRQPRAKIAAEQESREARRSLFILIGSFFITATVMCAVVVAIVCSTWTDVLMMSAFVLVFALLKIGLANALIYTMLRYDAATPEVPARAGGIGRHQQFGPIRQPPPVNERRAMARKTTKLRLATGSAQPRP